MKNTGTSDIQNYRLVISHYLASAICFVILAVMLFFSASDLSGHYFHPHLLAITHLAALGWGTLVIFGAAYQLIPVVFETNLPGKILPWLSFFFFLGGLVLLVFSFWIFDPGIYMQTGSLFLLAGITMFCLTVFLTAQYNKKKATIQQEYIITSCLWLLITSVMGVLLVFNFQYAFIPTDHLQFLKLHAHAGIAGWFLLLIVGVSSKLIPMFLVSRRQENKLLSWCYYLVNTALILFLVDTYFEGLNTKTYAIATIMILGIAAYVAYVFLCFKSRLKRPIDLPIFNTILSLGLLLTALFVTPFILRFYLHTDPFSIKLTNLYGTLVLMGWVSALILGQAFKTLPFIVWVKKYEHLAGKQKIPLPSELYKKSLLKGQTVAFSGFCLAFYSGYLIHSELLLRGGLLLLIITSLMYTGNLVFTLFHPSKH